MKSGPVPTRCAPMATMFRAFSLFSRASGQAGTRKGIGRTQDRDIRAFIAARRAKDLAAVGCSGRWRRCAASIAIWRVKDSGKCQPACHPHPAAQAPVARPLSPDDAARVMEEAGAHDVEWLGARDAALLTLLYGAGLRISEALSLKRGDVLWATAHHHGQGSQGKAGAGAAVVARSGDVYAGKIPFAGAPARRCFSPAAASR